MTKDGYCVWLWFNRWLKLRLELLGNLTTAFAALFTIMTEHLSASMAGLSVSYAVQVSI